MAVIFKNNLYGNITIDSNKIIGIMGDYRKFIKSIKGNISILSYEDDFYSDNVDYEMSLHIGDGNNTDGIKNIFIKEFGLDNEFLNKKISMLSDSEKYILKYLLTFLENKRVIVIDEPFINLDYNLKKMIKSLLKRIIYETGKTIIVGSNDSDVIYELCDKILLLGRDYSYGDKYNIMTDKLLLEKYGVDIPIMVDFINLIKKKKILIDYSDDIRDIIKDVYKCV